MFYPPHISGGGSGGTGSGGDMYQAIYDTDHDNVVDAAESVAWENIKNIPVSFPPASHTHQIASLSSAGFLSALSGNSTDVLTGLGTYVDISTLISGSGGGLTSVSWGIIQGSLSNQADLIAALNAKVPITRTINGMPLSSDITLTIPTKLSDLSDDSAHRLVTEAEKATWSGKQDALGYTPENATNKNVAGGYVGLGSNGKIDSSLIPALSLGTITSGTDYPSSPTKGDIFINTSTSKSYIYDGTQWIELSLTSGIQSVNGKTGTSVTLTASDLGLSNVQNYKAIQAISNAVAGYIPIWADTGSLLAGGFEVTSLYNATPSESKILTETGVRLAITNHTHGVASNSAAGFLPKLSGDASTFLDGMGNWSAMNAVTGLSLGTGASIYLDKLNDTLRFKSIKSGSGITITETANEIVIAAIAAISSGVWGSITGTITEQADLVTEFNKYVPKTRTINGLALTDNVTLPIPTRLLDLISDTTHRIVTDAQIVSWSNKQEALGYVPENVANKGIANGYAPLDSTGKVPSQFISSIALNNVTVGTAFPTSPSKGDMCIRTDEGKTYVYDGTQWITLSTGTYVQSVNGKTGTSVTLTKDDINLSNVTNDKQMKAIAGAVIGQIPVWADTGVTLSSIGYDVLTALSATPSNTSILTEKAVKDLISSIPGITILIAPTSGSTSAISAGWAYNHQSNLLPNVNHLTDAQISNLHSPVTVSGIGITISGQQIALNIGTGSTQVARGDHGHVEYLLKTEKAANSALLNGKTDTMFAPSVHVHSHNDLSDIGVNTHAAIDSFISSKGNASGLASLGTDGKVVASQLPQSIGGGLSYKGLYHGTSFPSIPVTGDFYVIDQTCTISSTSLNVSDWIIYNGTSWDIIRPTSGVVSVDGKTGAVSLSSTYAAILHTHKITDLSDINIVSPVDKSYLGYNAVSKKYELFALPTIPAALSPLSNSTTAKNKVVTFANAAGSEVKESNVTIVDNKVYNISIDCGNLDLL